VRAVVRGGLALELYRRHPELPRSLVLASAYAGWAGSLPPEVVRERVKRAMREAGLPPEQWVGGYLPGLFTGSAPPELLEEMTGTMLEVRPAGMRAMIRSFAEADLRDVLPGIRVPTLLLYGEDDRRSPLGTVAAELHERISGSRLRVMGGVGHAANLEAPERFNAEMREFLRSVP
jgi:pimeloyl-ACP methyl ester carboxylesterase